MLSDIIDFLPNIQSINPEYREKFALLCGGAACASTIQRELLCNFHVCSAIDSDNNGMYYVIPHVVLDEQNLTKFIRRGWNWDRYQPVHQYLVTLYNAETANKMYDLLAARGYNVVLYPNNLQLMIKCLDNSEHNDNLQKLKSELDVFEKSSPMSMDDYFNKILFNGKIENIEYRNMRKQEFDVKTIDQDRDAIIRGVLYQYFNKKIRAHLVRITFPKKFDANKLDQKLIHNINLIIDFLYSVAQEYVDKQVKTAVKTKHLLIIRFDYLKSCNEYDGFNRVLTLAKKWHRNNMIKERVLKHNLDLSNKGVYKIMDLDDGYYLVQLLTTSSLDYEGGALDHCLGDGYYDKKIHQPGIEIYSIRDKKGISHLTLEVNNGKIVQCFGYKNREMCDEKLRKIVRAVMREQNLDISDVNGWNKLIAYIKQDGELYDVFNLPKNFVTKHGLDLTGMDLEKLPDMSTVTVNGMFGCSTNKLSCADGAPHTVAGDCHFGNNPLVSLRGMPRNIGGEISLFNTQLNSKSFVPIYMENKLDDIVGIEEDVIDAWKEQIANRKSAIQNIMSSLLCKTKK